MRAETGREKEEGGKETWGKSRDTGVKAVSDTRTPAESVQCMGVRKWTGPDEYEKSRDPTAQASIGQGASAQPLA